MITMSDTLARIERVYLSLRQLEHDIDRATIDMDIDVVCGWVEYDANVLAEILKDAGRDVPEFVPETGEEEV